MLFIFGWLLTFDVCRSIAADGEWHSFNEARKHIIVVKGTGEPVEPTINLRRTSDGKLQCKVTLKSFPGSNAKEQAANYDDYLQQIIEGIDASPDKNLLFFIHGGMNYPTGAATHAADLLAWDKYQVPGFNLSAQGYPIFICWESPPTGYVEQVSWVRAGKTERYGHSFTHRAYALATLPFHLLADIGRGVTRFPAELSQFAHNDLYAISPTLFTDFNAMRREIHCIRGEPFPGEPRQEPCSLPPEDRIHVSPVPEVPSSAARYVEDAQTALLFPIRTLSLPALDAIGVGAWDNMLRHTGTIFDRTDTRRNRRSSTRAEDAVEFDQTGAIAMFFKRLSDRKDPHKIILTTHSMGAIIGNRIIISYPTLNYTKIVYMAAACSIRDFEASVVPYVCSHAGSSFYGLSLHPLCEAGEVALSAGGVPLDIAPRGSLPVWIDNIFGKPPAEEQCRLGIFQNAVLESHNIPRGRRNRFTFKYFAFGKKNPKDEPTWYPQHHGDFSDSPFWDQNFWTVDPQLPSVRARTTSKTAVTATNQ